MVLELSKGASATAGTSDATANGADGNSNDDDNAAVEDIKA
eukprot:CAMPEP_0183734464 /NCGR_PEP_ID=MMETSP0737-20130205/43906_1 /TAXON_ID=385413 /ORGANISM="Thalassiosira miniscula, Strain CCMP1093" /LENGTH=40 /DNA_ID= /DNA_START= /DNA_END= /DNA_ORIENTATION=